MFYLYFLESLQNNKVYVGKTNKHPIERVKEHNRGSNQWTKINRPFSLIYYEEYVCKEDASKREVFYKTGFGRSVKKLIVAYIKEQKIRITGCSSDG